MPPILILDGGLGTSLQQKYNTAFGPSTPLWSTDLLVSSPATLLACQSDFGRLPVDILLTATYQVSIEGFRNTRHPPSHPEGIPHADIPRFLEKAVHIAERAAAASSSSSSVAAIALSLGPYGACLVPSQEYTGRYDAAHDSPAALYEWHRERLGLLAEVEGLASRIGYVALETIPRVDEITAMRRALAGVPALRGVPFWMACLFPGEGEVLPSGESVADALRAMFDDGNDDDDGNNDDGNNDDQHDEHDDDGHAGVVIPWGVGINCTKVWKLPALLALYEDAVRDLLRGGILREWPALVLYPDGTNGEVYNTTTQTWEVPDGTAPEGGALPWEEQLAAAVRGTASRAEWKQIVVGGCCMASAEDIGRLRGVLL